MKKLLFRLEHFLPFVFVVLFVFALIFYVLRKANPLLAFPSLDSGYYLYIGQQILQGKIPYIDLWESKPPGIFYINALGLWLGRGTRWGIWGLELLFLLSSSAISFYLINKKSGFFPALFGVLAWLWGLHGVLQGGNLTEEYSLPINFASALLFYFALESHQKKIYPFLIGIGFALSFLLRANNTGVQISIVLAWIIFALWVRDFQTLLARLLWSGLGVALVLGATSLILVWQGNLREMIDASLIFNFFLSGARKDLFSSLSNGFSFIGIPAGFAFLGYLLLLVLAPKRNLWTLFLLISFPVEIFLSGLSGRGYPHYYILWMPSIAFLSAYLIKALPDFCFALERKRFWVSFSVLVLTVLFLLAPIKETIFSIQRIIFHRELGVQADHPVSTYIYQHTDPEDKVLVWGARLIFNYLSFRESPSSVLFYPLLVDSPVSQRLADRFLEEIISNPPELIVDTYAINQDLLPSLDPDVRREQEKLGKLWPALPENISGFYEFVAQNYEFEKEIDDYYIYRMRTP